MHLLYAGVDLSMNVDNVSQYPHLDVYPGTIYAI